MFATYYTYGKVKLEFSKSGNLANKASTLSIEIIVSIFAIELCKNLMNFFTNETYLNEFTVFLLIFALPATILRIIIYYDELSLKFRSLFNIPNETKS